MCVVDEMNTFFGYKQNTPPLIVTGRIFFRNGSYRGLRPSRMTFLCLTG